MIQEKIINGQKHWLNHKGETVPARMVSPLEKSASRLLQRQVKKLKYLSNALIKARKILDADLEKHFDLVRRETGVDALLTGNKTIIDLDQDTKLQIRTPKRVFFDETSLVAVELLERYFDGRQIDEEIRIFMKDILGIREKRNIDQAKLHVIYRHETKDQDFRKAVSILKKSEREETGKTYINLYIRNGNDQDWQLIPLNFSAISENGNE